MEMHEDVNRHGHSPVSLVIARDYPTHFRAFSTLASRWQPYKESPLLHLDISLSLQTTLGATSSEQGSKVYFLRQRGVWNYALCTPPLISHWIVTNSIHGVNPCSRRTQALPWPFVRHGADSWRVMWIYEGRWDNRFGGIEPLNYDRCVDRVGAHWHFKAEATTPECLELIIALFFPRSLSAT